MISNPRRLGLSALLAAGLSICLAACGSSGSPPGSTTTASGSNSTTTTSISSASADAEIRSAYTTLFALDNPAVAPKLAAVQDGAQLKQAFVKELKSPLAKLAAGAKVLSITIEKGTSCRSEALPSPCAKVTYDILSPKHKPVLANSKGFAVYLNGRWLVAKTTICTLMSLANDNVMPKGC
jgi:hypothetical protein